MSNSVADSADFAIVDVELENGIQADMQAKGLIDRALESRQNPIVVDFLSSKLRHRIKNGVDGETIVKAIGVKRSERAGLMIYDFTAGLGTEAFLLAIAGFSVVAFERDARVFELLQDGLKRWQMYETEQELTPLSLEFRLGDAADVVGRGELSPAHAVMLDPMFEGDALEGKSAPKKEMATFRRMLRPSSDEELQALLKAAFEVADVRVVVKRPSGAPELKRPTRRLEGKTARFDIYSCR